MREAHHATAFRKEGGNQTVPVSFNPVPFRKTMLQNEFQMVLNRTLFSEKIACG